MHLHVSLLNPTSLKDPVTWAPDDHLLSILYRIHLACICLRNCVKQGHDFVVIGRSPALDNTNLSDPMKTVQHFDPVLDTPNLNFTNPTRRDATMLPGKGWLIVAFRNDNPGAWLFHCHIAVSNFIHAPLSLPSHCVLTQG